MCSGCSGNYEGGSDFEHADDLAADWNATSPSWLRDECHVDLGATDKTGRNWFEAKASEGDSLDSGDESGSETGPKTGIEQGRKESLALPNFESYSEESCEILVSETQIIEICRIPATSRHINDLQQMRASESSAAPQHSGTESAKYYQTHKCRAHEAGNHMQVADPVPVPEATAGRSKSWIEKWFKRARRAIGKSRGHNFRAS